MERTLLVRCRSLLPALVAVLGLGVPGAAQDDENAPPAEELVRELRKELDEVQKHQKELQRFSNSFDHTGKDEEERKQKAIEFGKELTKLMARVTRSLASVDRVLRPLFAAKKDEHKGTTPAHFVLATEALTKGEQSGRAIRVGAHGIDLFPKDFVVRVTQGDALLASALEADDDDFSDLIDEAEKCYLRARAMDEKSWRPYFGLYRIQEVIGEDEKALEHLEKALEQKGADDEIERPRIRRGQLLLRLGRVKDAAKQIDTSLARKQDLFQACVLAARSYALEGDKKRALRAFEWLRKDEGESLRVVQAEADLLWALGEKSDARRLLRDKLPPKKEGESLEVLHERQSAEAMACLMEHVDGDLEKARLALPAILGIQFFTQMPKEDDPETYERRNVDRNPTFILYQLQRADKTPQYWAEEVLATLCQFALPVYEASEAEKFVEVQLFDYDERERLRKEDERKAQLEYLESYLGTPDFRGALFVRDIVTRLRK